MSDDTVDLTTVQLVADIVQANYNGYASTTDRLMINHLRQAETQAKAVLAIFEILDDATVIDRRTEERLWAIGYLRESAERSLEHVQRQLAIYEGGDEGRAT